MNEGVAEEEHEGRSRRDGGTEGKLLLPVGMHALSQGGKAKAEHAGEHHGKEGADEAEIQAADGKELDIAAAETVAPEETVHQEGDAQDAAAEEDAAKDALEHVLPGRAHQEGPDEPGEDRHDVAAIRDDAVVQVGQGQDEEAAEKDPVAQAEPGKVKAQEAQEGQDGENQLGQGVAGRDLHPAAFAAAALKKPAENRDQLGRAEDMPAGGAVAAPPEGRLTLGDAPGDAVEE